MSGCDCGQKSGQPKASQMGVLERPRYSPGLILEDSDLTAAVNYTRELNRLLFRSLFGCGVLCGLDVTVKIDCDLVVTVNPGIGLDGCGDPIHLTGQQPIRLSKRVVVLPDPDAPGGAPARTDLKTDFWVIACNREKNCAPRSVVCDGDDLDCSSQMTRTRSAVEISVTFEPPQCKCGCGLFTDSPDLNQLALQMRDDHKGRLNVDWKDDTTERCHDAHNHEAACAPDCGCGTACSCGCCVLLAWVHWFDGEGETLGAWKALHHGVRRFVRPTLMGDPLWDYTATAT